MTLHPGRPSEGDVLSKLLHCDRCGRRMHGTIGGRQGVRRCYCATRKQAGSCDQPITLAEPLEEQLARYVRQFVSPAEVRKAIVRRLKQEAKSSGQHDTAAKRTELEGQLKRLKELFILGDLPKSQYLYRRQLLQQEIDSLEPPVIVDVTEAARALTNFGLFWERETDPGERNKLLRLVFDKIWADDRRLVAVRPPRRLPPLLPVRSRGGKRG